MFFLRPAQRIIKTIYRHKSVVGFLLFCFLVIVPFARASSLDDFYKAQSVEGQNRQKFSAGTGLDTQHMLIAEIAGGCSDANCPDDFKVGAIGVTSNMIAGLYANPPASGVTYFADVFHHLNPVQPAYAQTGTGFNTLGPILPVWKAFRNFAYVLFAIVFIFIGLAIMFRMKLDPRTTLTIQSAIPRIVVALLLVTFSYAMAGLLIDLMYVLISLVGLVFGAVPGFDAASIQSNFLTGGFPQVIGNTLAVIGGAAWTVVGTLGIASLITAGVGALIGGTLTGALPLVAIGAALPTLIFLVIILYLLFKLFMELLKAYIMIVVLVVLAPLQIAIGAIPGVPGFGAWFKNIMANILVFPAVAFVLLIAQAMVRSSGQGLWTAPMISGSILGLNFLPLLIGFGFLLIVHQVPQVIKNIFGIRGLGFAVGEAFGGTPVKGAYLGGAQYGITQLEAFGTAGAGTRGGAIRSGAASVLRKMTGLRG